jgi:uncharacterized protein YdhG (YjbR/CyaY superfamily)
MAYIDGIAPENRALFERLHAIILAAHPDAEVALSYDMPAYRVGARRLNLGAWKHCVSVYGWRRDNDGGFVTRHPELSSGKATIRIRPRDADGLSDEELSALLGGALEA